MSLRPFMFVVGALSSAVLATAPLSPAAAGNMGGSYGGAMHGGMAGGSMHGGYTPSGSTCKNGGGSNITINKPVTIYKPVTINKNITVNNNIDNSKNININKNINITKNIDNSKNINITKNIDNSKNININKTIIINKGGGGGSAEAEASAFAQAMASATANANVTVNVGASAGANAGANAGAGAATYVGSYQFTSVVNRGGSFSNVRVSEHCETQEASVVKAIHAVCVSADGREFPASHMIAETWVDSSYEGEVARCIAGSRLKIVIGDVLQSDQGMAGTYANGLILQCGEHEAVRHYKDGMLKCAPAVAVPDCTERTNLRKYGTGDLFFTYRTMVCVSSSHTAAASELDVTGMALEGGVGESDY